MISVRPTLLDRMVSAVDPVRGTQRLAARATLAAATALTTPPTEPGGSVFGQGGYNAGKSGRRQTRGWTAKTRSANADQAKRQTLIARSRDAAMNMPMATAAIERSVAFTIGTGLMAIPDIDPSRVGVSPEAVDVLKARIAADYDEYMASTDPDAERTATGYGLQDIILRAVLESGDVLGLRVMPETQVGRTSTTAWKLIEADRVASPVGHIEGARLERGAGRGNVCVFGVEVDGFGAPIAYHVVTRASDFGGITARVTEGTRRIPAWGEKSELPTCLHVLARRRPEQVRGVPMLAPVLETLRQLSDLTEAELFAAVLTAMLAIVYKSPGAAPMPEPEYGAATDEEAIVQGGYAVDNPERPQSNYRLEAGSVMEIDSDGEVDMKSPGRPNPEFDPFFMGMMRQLAAAVEVPVEVLMLHFTASYSASRGALEVFYITVRRRREWMASHWCAPGYRAWLHEQVARGRYVLKGFLTDANARAAWSAVRFRGDGKISIDPAREAKALETQEAHAWRTGAEITAELTGGDYDANVRTRIGEHQRFVDGGLPIPNAKGGGTEPATAHQEEE